MTTRWAVDVAIVGAGVSGLWLRAVMAARGYRVLTIDRDAIGGGQTRYAQGIVHGGLKYALGATLTNAATTIAGMPARWRRHLRGDGVPNLTGMPLLSDSYYLLTSDGIADRLKGFFASKALHGRVERVARDALPAFASSTDFQGEIYRLEDFVADPRVLAHRLASTSDAPLLHAHLQQANVQADGVTLRVAGADRAELEVSAHWLVLCAGAGNAAVLAQLGRRTPAMQRRPLHQVWLRGAAWPALYTHCLPAGIALEPRLTLVSHTDVDGPVVSVGGVLATGGVGRSAAEQAAHARKELAHCLPWLDTTDLEVACKEIDRAEPQQASSARPDNAFVDAAGPVLTCWPTKLTLAPALADRVLAHIESGPRSTSDGSAPPEVAAWPRPPLAPPPWESLAWN